MGYRQAQHDQPDAVAAEETTQSEKGDGKQPSTTFPLTGTKQANDKPETSAEKRPNKPEEWGLSDKIAAVASIVAFLQFIALIATWWLMARTARRQLRAYVALFGGEIAIVREGGSGLKIHVELRNSGQTPAYDFTTWIARPVVDVPGALPFGPPRPIQDRTGASIVAPGASAHIHWTMAADAAMIADLQNGTKKLFIWGGCDYTDVFGHRRDFMFRDTNGDEVFQPIRGWSIAPHKFGYEASEQRHG